MKRRAIDIALVVAAAAAAASACSGSDEIDRMRSPPNQVGTGGSGREGGLGSGGSPTEGGMTVSGAPGAGGDPNDGGMGAGGSGPSTGGATLDGGVTHTTLPPRPVWTPAIPLGAPGWRQSVEPFCSEDVALLSARVWSTNEVVYVLVGGDCSTLDRRFACNYVGTFRSVAVYANDGTKWRTVYQRYGFAAAASVITGYPDGRPVLLGGGDCPVTLIDRNDDATCIWTGRPDFRGGMAVTTDSGELFVIGTYDDGSSTQELFAYDGQSWTSIKTWTGSDAGGTLRTDGSTVFVGGGKQYVWSFDPVQRTESQMQGVPAGLYSTSWFFGPKNLLLGNGLGGLAHYDGVQWTFLDTGFKDALYGMWGATDGTAFVYAQGTIGRWKADRFEILHRDYFDANNSQWVTDVWGNSSTEVFFAVNDNAFQSYTCGTTFLVWFDGTAFHQF